MLKKVFTQGSSKLTKSNLLFKNFCAGATGNFRVEYDTFGPVNVPNDKYWAAQTQRSLQNFAIGTKEDKMPISVIRAMAIIKKCAAKVIISLTTIITIIIKLYLSFIINIIFTKLIFLNYFFEEKKNFILFLFFKSIFFYILILLLCKHFIIKHNNNMIV